ncbi:hypothetical protein DRO61_04105 [Candidatus Bathyarchaeota archaeon]|nr:MAG: hypothetical protein DRO61_04105 [Candidatus Bathyarchaeota archaeon]
MSEDFINIIQPEHGRTSCSDDNLSNGFYTRDGVNWHGRCTRCMYLEIARNGDIPREFNWEECEG